jgi:hypothetical protein
MQTSRSYIVYFNTVKGVDIGSAMSQLLFGDPLMSLGEYNIPAMSNIV